MIDLYRKNAFSTRAVCAVFCSGPLACANDRKSRAVDDEMKAFSRRDSAQRDVEMLATPRERRVIGRGKVEAQHPEDRRQKALGLTEWQVEEESERQRGFDGEIGILQLSSTLADAHGLPCGDRVRRHPHRDIASLDERPIVIRPVLDVVFRLVPLVHSRLHVEIVLLPPP